MSLYAARHVTLYADTTGHRGRSGDPLYAIRRALLTREELLTDKQKARLWKAFVAHDALAAVEVTYRLYQGLINAYEQPRRRDGKIAMYKLLRSIRAGVPAELPELAQLGRSLWKRHREILANFDVGASNGPVEAINGRLEHLRGIALGFATSSTTSCDHSSTQDSSRTESTHSKTGRAG